MYRSMLSSMFVHPVVCAVCITTEVSSQDGVLFTRSDVERQIYEFIYDARHTPSRMLHHQIITQAEQYCFVFGSISS